MIKHLSDLGDRWYEVIANIFILILVSPIILAAFIIFLPLLAYDSLLRWARKEPKPEIPKVAGETEIASEEHISVYLAKAKNLVNDLLVRHNEDDMVYILNSSKLAQRSVRFEYDHGFASISIDGLNCYAWNSSESADLDPFFWTAVAALKNGIHDARTVFGRKVFWIKSDELMVWIRVGKFGSTLDSMDYYVNPPANTFE